MPLSSRKLEDSNRGPRTIPRVIDLTDLGKPAGEFEARQSAQKKPRRSGAKVRPFKRVSETPIMTIALVAAFTQWP